MADRADLINREGAALDSVLHLALNLAAERFNPNEADPGWSAEMYEDLLRDAVIVYANAIKERRNGSI